jgi:PAS domain S-box-containing protein
MSTRATTAPPATSQAAPPEARLLAAVFDRLPVGAGICDENGRFIAVNARLARLLGRAKSEIIGRPFLAFLHSQDRAACLAGYFDAVVATQPTQQPAAGQRTLRWLSGDGATVPLVPRWTVNRPGPSRSRRAILQLSSGSALPHDPLQR